MRAKPVGCVGNGVDIDETQHSVASGLGQHFLLRFVCPNTAELYGIYFII